MSVKSYNEISYKYRQSIELINEGINNHKLIEIDNIRCLLNTLDSYIFYDKYLSLKRKLDIYESIISSQHMIDYF